jgi:hypothetical protein
LYYLQSRYYNPAIGRFINADVLVSSGQGILGNNMFAYCTNNPVGYSDPNGNKARPVGAGVQVEVSVGHTSVGIEVILYWDVEECINGAPVIAVYVYGGVSVDVNDYFIASIVGVITDNADLLLDSTGAGVMTVAALIGDSFSVSVSGVFIVGNEQFVSTKSYEESFTAVGGGLGKAKVSMAYSESCVAFSAGYNVIGGNSILPSSNVAKTYYQQLFVIQFGKAVSNQLHDGRTVREIAYA